MKAEDRLVLRRLLTEVRVLSLGVLVDGTPYVGLVPFAVGTNRGSALVHASGTLTKAVGGDELAVSRARQRNIRGWQRPRKANKED